MKLSVFKAAVAKIEADIFGQCWVSGKINEIPDPEIFVADEFGNDKYEPMLQLKKTETGFTIFL